MACSDLQYSPSFSDPNPSSEELENGEGAVGREPTAASPSLSSHSSKGGSATRVRKRKASRGAERPHVPPVRRLSADKCNFRDVVHQFTGNPSPPAASPHKLPFFAADSQHKALLAAAITQSLSSLHMISSYLLLHGCSQDNIKMLSEINKSKSLAILQTLLHSQLQESEMATNHSGLSSSKCGDLGLLFASQLHNNPNDTLNNNMNRVASQAGLPQGLQQSQQVAQLESFLLKGNDEMDIFFSSL